VSVLSAVRDRLRDNETSFSTVIVHGIDCWVVERVREFRDATAAERGTCAHGGAPLFRLAKAATMERGIG